MHAIILAGGFGTRLKSVVADTPKPLAPVSGKPFLAWLLEALAQGGVHSVTLSVHHMWEQIRDYFDTHGAPVKIDYAIETTPLGTGGAIFYALQQIQSAEPVLVLNGDTYVKTDYTALLGQHRSAGADITMTLRQINDTGRYGQVLLHGRQVRAFAPGTQGASGLINAGVYCISPSLPAKLSMPQAFSFETDLLPSVLDTLTVSGMVTDDYFIDIGIPDDYKRAQTEIPLLFS